MRIHPYGRCDGDGWHALRSAQLYRGAEKERSPCLVLDPFMGSGTVAVVARELNRSSVGCELNPEYVKIIKKRLQSDSCLDTGTVNYRFEKVPPP